MSLPVVPGFILAERLGVGSYATVYKAFRKGEVREVVAIKCVEISSLSKAAVNNLLTEIGMLKKFKHQFIVEMKDFQWDEKFIFIIMEYCSGGDLSTFIRSRRTLPETVVKRFLQQLATALQFLRSQNICHMDLKPQNILLSSVQDPVLKLADFGFAQYLKPQDDATSLRGSPLYMAPEILLNQKYDARVDLWSVGVILYECLFGQAPYSSKTFSELIEKIKNPKPIQIPYGVTISDGCRNLLMSLLQRDPEKRISYDEFFADEFLDLEHMPSSSCYETAVQLLTEAVKFDQQKNYAEAVYKYCEALRYFVPAIQFEKEQEKKKVMRKKAQEYISRAEYLKQFLKPQTLSADYIALHSAFEELYNLCNDLPHLQAALKVANAAELLETKEKYEESLEKYNLAFETIIPIMMDEPKSRRKELLMVEINRLMTKAEAVKSYLSVRNATKPNDAVDLSENGNFSQRQQCCIQ